MLLTAGTQLQANCGTTMRYKASQQQRSTRRQGYQVRSNTQAVQGEAARAAYGTHAVTLRKLNDYGKRENEQQR